jgi:hypothetical protein
MAGVPVSAGGGCKAQQGNETTPSAIQCPVSAVSSVAFLFKKGGGWSAYAGGGGQHAGGCSPVPVTVRSGPDGLTVSINSWNGCKETIYCDSPASMFVAVEADADDVINGKCSSVVRH